MVNGEIKMMIVTSQGDEPDVRDGKDLRRTDLAASVPLITTVSVELQLLEPSMLCGRRPLSRLLFRTTSK
jgi:hypothetical protein